MKQTETAKPQQIVLNENIKSYFKDLTKDYTQEMCKVKSVLDVLLSFTAEKGETYGIAPEYQQFFWDINNTLSIVIDKIPFEEIEVIDKVREAIQNLKVV